MRVFCFLQFPIVLIIGGVLILTIRFSHPEMTETQLFLNFYPLYVIMGATFFASLFLFERATNNKLKRNK